MNLLHEIDISIFEVGAELESTVAVDVEYVLVLFGRKIAAATLALLHLGEIIVNLLLVKIGKGDGSLL